MRIMGSLLLAAALAAGYTATPASARSAPRATPTNVAGIVTSVDAGTKSFVLQNKTGLGKRAKTQNLTVMTTSRTTFKHVGKLPLTRKPASFADLAVNEKVQVKGLPAKAGHVGDSYVLIKHEPSKK